jgi:hypothetical protein
LYEPRGFRKMIWKRKHKCAICKTDVFYDDKKHQIACACGKFEVKNIAYFIQNDLLGKHFEKTYAVKMNLLGYDPVFT